MPNPQVSTASAGYPPPPWRLKGEADLSVWLLPRDALAFSTPPGWRPLRLMGRLVVGAVIARYGPDGDLAYRELAVGVAVRRGLRLGVTLPWAWVDSAASLAGGRALWAIPKRPGTFRRAGAQLEATDEEGRLIAARRGEPVVPLPGRWPLRISVAQPDGDAAVVAPARLHAILAVTRSRWRAGGPLRRLDATRPLLSLRLQRAALRFGAEGID